MIKDSQNLHVHHKDFDSMNNNLGNAQVVCQACHVEIHKLEDERLFREHAEAVHLQDMKTEQGMKDAWVANGRLLDEIGGQEFNEFSHDWTSEDA